MSKELTEKLENRTLDTGYYYAKLYEWDEDDDEVNDIFSSIIEVNDGLVSYSGDGVDEVLAPVPSYEEVHKLKERIADADKTIEEVKNCIEKNRGKNNGFAVVVSGILINEYLEKWGVK